MWLRVATSPYTHRTNILYLPSCNSSGTDTTVNVKTFAAVQTNFQRPPIVLLCSYTCDRASILNSLTPTSTTFPSLLFLRTHPFQFPPRHPYPNFARCRSATAIPHAWNENFFTRICSIPAVRLLATPEHPAYCEHPICEHLINPNIVSPVETHRIRRIRSASLAPSCNYSLSGGGRRCTPSAFRSPARSSVVASLCTLVACHVFRNFFVRPGDSGGGVETMPHYVRSKGTIRNSPVSVNNRETALHLLHPLRSSCPIACQMSATPCALCLLRVDLLFRHYTIVVHVYI